jgi:hypothetical protein
MRNGRVVNLLLITTAAISSLAYASGQSPKGNDKVTLTVKATVKASAHNAGGKDQGKLDDELTAQLTETVEYKIKSDDGGGNISLEMVSHKNRMTANGKGSLLSNSGGVETWQKWTYSINPESSWPNSGIAELDSSPPCKIRIAVDDFFRNCNGKASGTEKYATGWDPGANAPTYEIVPLETLGFASLAENWVFASPEDLQLAAKGEMTDLVKKLQATYTPRKDGGFFASGSASHSYQKKDGREIALEGSVNISWSVQCGERPASEVEVTLDGCSELGEGVEGRMTATGRPEGGSYHFWAEPEEILSIEANGASAALRGVSPGRGTLYVEYTSPEGKTAQASRPAACVKVESFNGGEPIPQISLFDGNGKRVPGIRTIPVMVKPADAADRLEYVHADPAVLTAVNLGDSIQLQGVREGKTTLQARIKCSGMLGPVVTVEVVPCDEETIAKLAEESRIATEAQKAAEKDFMDALGSKEFEEASDKIADSTGNLLIKTGGLIIGTLGGAGGASKAAQTASGIYGVGSNLLDTLKGGDTLSQVSNVSQMIVELGGSAMQQAISGTIETLQAATEFGKHLGSLMSTADRMAAAAKWHEHWGRVIEDIVRRQKICRKGTGEPPRQGEPPAEPKPPKTDPKKPTPKPTEPTPETEPPPGQEPPAQEPPGGEPPSDEPPISPPPPTSPPRQVGLPYDPGNCGCDKTQGIGTSQAGLSTLQSGLARLGECVETFRSDALTDYLQTLKEWSAVSTKLGAASKAGGAELMSTAKQMIPDIQSLLTRTKSFDEAGRAFYEGFKTCPKSMEAGMSVLKSSNEIVGTPGTKK